MKTLDLNQMEKLNGGHVTPEQCVAMSIAAVAAGVLMTPIAGFFAAVGVAIACGDV